MKTKNTFRNNLFLFLERENSQNNLLSGLYAGLMMMMIFISIIPLAFNEEKVIFVYFEKISVSLFILDYILRWITADYKLKFKNKFFAFLVYPITPMAMIDLISILPALNFINQVFKVFRCVRLVKILRILRFIRYSSQILLLIKVLKKESKILISVLIIAIFYIFTSALVMFNIENGTKPEFGQKDYFDNFFDAVYWATTTLTTVGYGDICPTSNVGRVISMLSAIFGVAIIALPSGVITASSLDELREMKNKKPSNTPTENDKE